VTFIVDTFPPCYHWPCEKHLDALSEHCREKYERKS